MLADYQVRDYKDAFYTLVFTKIMIKEVEKTMCVIGGNVFATISMKRNHQH